MRTKQWQQILASLVVSSLVFSALHTANADWAEDFDNGFTKLWQFGSQGGDGSTFNNGQIIDGQLVLTDTRNPGGDGGAETGFGTVFPDTFTDVRMTGVINPGGNPDINDTVALLIRGNTVNQSFYMAEINYTSGELIIYRNNPGFDGGNSNLAIEPIPGLQFSDGLYVEIEATGSFIETWAYEYNVQTKEIGNLRATTSFDDTSEAALSSGLSGVLVHENFNGLPVLGVWDDLTSSTIVPDPVSDINGDGDVDGDDLLLIQQGQGPTTIAQDIANWQSEYPIPMPIGAISAVPEPGSLGLACGLLLILGGCSRRG